jgi:cobalt/nickel transport system ATP-binding protein
VEPVKLVLEGVCHRYPGARADSPAPVSAVLHAGEKALLEGPVGAGKTTLLLRIAGLREGPGRVLAGEQEVTRRSAAAIRRAVGFLWQNPDDGLFLPGVLDDVALGPLNDGLSPDEALGRARRQLEEVGVVHLASREVTTLSRGERQLVALAGLMAREPGLLLLDEPLSALDEELREGLGDELRRVQKETGLTAVMVSHSKAETARLCDELLELRSGSLDGGRLSVY